MELSLTKLSRGPVFNNNGNKEGSKNHRIQGCVCVCVCVCKRERERDDVALSIGCVTVCVGVASFNQVLPMLLLFISLAQLCNINFAIA